MKCMSAMSWFPAPTSSPCLCKPKLADVLAVFRDAGHSRLPVHGDTLDDPRGMVHIRDFVGYFAAAAKPPDRPQSATGAIG